MKTVYPTILTKVDDGFLVEVPDLDILTEGSDLNNAIYMARDAIGLKGITLQDMGEAIPDASPIGAIDPEKGTFAEDGAGLVTLVDIDFDAYRRRVDQKMVRRNVTLPSWMDAEATAAHINVSRVLQDALRDQLSVAK